MSTQISSRATSRWRFAHCVLKFWKYSVLIWHKLAGGEDKKAVTRSPEPTDALANCKTPKQVAAAVTSKPQHSTTIRRRRTSSRVRPNLFTKRSISRSIKRSLSMCIGAETVYQMRLRAKSRSISRSTIHTLCAFS
jgi:hypothetical protein